MQAYIGTAGGSTFSSHLAGEDETSPASGRDMRPSPSSHACLAPGASGAVLREPTAAWALNVSPMAVRGITELEEKLAPRR